MLASRSASNNVASATVGSIAFTIPSTSISCVLELHTSNGEPAGPVVETGELASALKVPFVARPSELSIAAMTFAAPASKRSWRSFDDDPAIAASNLINPVKIDWPTGGAIANPPSRRLPSHPVTKRRRCFTKP